VHDFGIGHRLAAGSHAIEEIAHMVHRALGAGHVFAHHFFEIREQGRGGSLRFGVVVGCANPAFGAFEALATRAMPVFVAAGQNHFHAIGKGGDHAVTGRVVHILVSHRRGIQRVDAGLGLCKGMGTPFANATGMKIIVTAPATADITRMIGPPRAGAEPGVPVNVVLGWLRLGGLAIKTHDGGIPRGDVRIGGVHLAEPPGTRGLDGKHMIRLAEPLGSGLVDPAVFARGFHHRLALGNRHARRLFRIHILAGAHR